MKWVIRAIVYIGCWLLLETLAGCSLNREKNQNQAFSPLSKLLHSYYHCPNHPEIKQYNPGYCSICHSDLEKPGSLAIDKPHSIITIRSEKLIVFHVNEEVKIESANKTEGLKSQMAHLTWKNSRMYMNLAGHEYKIVDSLPVFERKSTKKWILIEDIKFNNKQHISSISILKKVVWIPKEYLIAEGDQYYLLAEIQGKIVKTRVFKGYISGEYIEVEGLKPGTTLHLPD